ncbi:MAG TPA: N-formylglutamate amidohydrolase [Allosphingosinicella sp.]|nr:N-formylglutamate amidohydrolase [Allosphingosinicella sp.]
MPASPVVLSVPHAGREYSPALLRASRLPIEKLEALEDRLVDRLVWRAAAAGVPAIIAKSPRAEIDLNRDEREIDPLTVAPPPPSREVMQSARTRGGLGLIPSRIAGAGSIWLHRTPQDEVRRRLDQVYRPYHEALEQALGQARTAFGIAILLDCHSMPPRSTRSGGEAELVFGDCHGTSIVPELLDAAIGAARREGFSTACNAPYAGGYITSRHGRPAADIHALQLEIDRSLYLADDLRSPGPGFDRVARLIAAIAAALAERATGSGLPIAAE